MNSQVLNGTAITDTSLVDLCAFMNAASISNIPILLSAQSAGALVKAMTTSAPVQPVAVPDGWCQFIDGVKTQNVARNEKELADIKHLFKVMGHEAYRTAEYRPFYFAAPAAQGDVKDAERLRWMAESGARVSWSMDGEYCSVWLPAERDGTESLPAEGYPQKCYDSWHRAIDAAIAAKAAS